MVALLTFASLLGGFVSARAVQTIQLGEYGATKAYATGDLDQLNVSTDKITKRALKIESMDVSETNVIVEDKPHVRLASG